MTEARDRRDEPFKLTWQKAKVEGRVGNRGQFFNLPQNMDLNYNINQGNFTQKTIFNVPCVGTQ